MTIDERLEALTSRHEALAQTVELLVAMLRDNEQAQQEREREREQERARAEKERARAEKERARAEKERKEAQRKRDVRIDELHADMMLAIAQLANTAEAHNGQLADHEERIDHLETK